MANGPEAAPVRGLLLIGAAVLIGVLFLAKGFDAPGGINFDAGAIPSSATTVPEGAGTGTDTTDDTAVISGTGGTQTTQLPPAQLPVLVVNASGVSGAATAVTNTLTGAGYALAIPPSGSAPTNTDVTLVYYFEDPATGASYQADAQLVATALGIQPTQVQPMPDPTTLGVDIGSATVVVWLGTDHAPAA